MLFLRRASRRIKTAFWSCWYVVFYAFKALRFRYLMSQYAYSEKYIRQAFRYLVELGVDELRVVEGFPTEGRLSMYAVGNMLQLKHEVERDGKWERWYEAVLNENAAGQLYLHVWNDKKRVVNMEYGAKFETNWYEPFRTGRSVEPNETGKFLWYLTRLYGEGPKDAV